MYDLLQSDVYHILFWISFVVLDCNSVVVVDADGESTLIGVLLYFYRRSPTISFFECRTRRRSKIYYRGGAYKEQAGIVLIYTRPMYATIIDGPVPVEA
jgi:hypothetical protein